MRDDAFRDARNRCLRLLQARQAALPGSGADTQELSTTAVGGEEGTRRVRELRQMGYPIRRRVLPTGYWYYWLADDDTGQQQSLFEEVT